MICITYYNYCHQIHNSKLSVIYMYNDARINFWSQLEFVYKNMKAGAWSQPTPNAHFH